MHARYPKSDNKAIIMIIDYSLPYTYVNHATAGSVNTVLGIGGSCTEFTAYQLW